MGDGRGKLGSACNNGLVFSLMRVVPSEVGIGPRIRLQNKAVLGLKG